MRPETAAVAAVTRPVVGIENPPVGLRTGEAWEDTCGMMTACDAVTRAAGWARPVAVSGWPTAEPSVAGAPAAPSDDAGTDDAAARGATPPTPWY